MRQSIENYGMNYILTMDLCGRVIAIGIVIALVVAIFSPTVEHIWLVILLGLTMNFVRLGNLEQQRTLHRKGIEGESYGNGDM